MSEAPVSPGLLSRAVEALGGAISPRWAGRRRAARDHFARMETDAEYSALVFSLLRARGYQAARTGRNDGGWLGGSGSGDAELTHDLASMRNRSRELDRDDSVAGGIFSTMVQNIVGTELRPQARTGDREKNKRLEAVWRERKDRLFPAERQNMGRVQRRIERRIECDGDVFVKPAKRSPEDPVWFELIEADRVSAPLGLRPPAGGRIQDGVAKDADGLWLSVYIGPAGSLKPAEFRAVDAEQIYHDGLGDRAGLTRGEPLLHAVMQEIRDLDLLILAALKRTQIAACLALFIETEGDATDLFDLTARTYGYRLNESIEPGMMFKLFPGEKASTLVPNFPLPELVPFVVVLAARIGAAVGLTWEYVLRNWKEDTYSSSRTGQLACEPTWAARKHDLTRNLLTPMWLAVMADAAERGDARLAGITPDEMRLVEWQGDGRRWVDPAKESKAKATARKIGVETLYDQCAEAGHEAEEQIDREMATYRYCVDAGLPEDVARLRAFGIEPPGAPGGSSAMSDAAAQAVEDALDERTA